MNVIGYSHVIGGSSEQLFLALGGLLRRLPYLSGVDRRDHEVLIEGHIVEVVHLVGTHSDRRNEIAWKVMLVLLEIQLSQPRIT